ncbi:MAG: glycosyltransferase [Candidatus Paceibacterota bacterium]
MIPKKIHQIWVGPNPLPIRSVGYIEKIKSLHPEYEYRLWTNVDVTPENFVNYEYILQANNFAQKADIMRYEILCKHGGIYLDIDFEILKNLTPLLTHDLVSCNETEDHSLYISNAFIASTIGNPNIQRCVENISTVTLNTKDINFQTGPFYFRKCLILDETVNILKTIVMYPSRTRRQPKKYSPTTYGTHHWHGRW